MIELLFRGRRVVFDSPHGVTEAQARLAREVAVPEWTMRRDQRTQLFVGTVADGRFEVVRLVRGRNSFRPMLAGQLSPSAGGSRIERAWQRQTHGVLPLNAEWLATNHPELWPSREAAKKDVARKGGQFSNINSINNLSLFEFEYRPARQRVWSRCLCKKGGPEFVAASLRMLLGKPVEVRRPERTKQLEVAA